MATESGSTRTDTAWRASRSYLLAPMLLTGALLLASSCGDSETVMNESKDLRLRARYYDTTGLTPEELRRAAQLEKLYGFEFPTELFHVWRWHKLLSPAQQQTLKEIAGISLAGPIDVLRGKFDTVELAYPTVLHCRFRFDPPEFVTILSGNMDGLHWGYWFDDHARLPPVVAHCYTDSPLQIFQSGDTAFAAIQSAIDLLMKEFVNTIEYHPDTRGDYQSNLAALDELAATLPPPEPQRHRDAVATCDEMGVVLPLDANSTQRVMLLRGKQLWCDGSREAFEVLEKAYLALDRPVLAARVRTHGQNPILPRASVLDYPKGSFLSLDRALASPTSVLRLVLPHTDLVELPDLSAMTNLEELDLLGNRLSELPPSLAQCRKLRRINLFRNRMTRVPPVLFEFEHFELIILGSGLPAADIDRLRVRYPQAEIL